MSFFSELRRRNVIRVALAYSVVAWLVAQVAEMAFESFGTPDWAMKTLLFVLVMGLPLALVIAWAFEMTPDGIKLEKDVVRSESITDTTGRKLNYTIIAVLAIALVLSLVSRDWSQAPADVVAGDSAAAGAQSIAVLPFVNMSDDRENEFFSDGISEELLNVLVKVEGLRVASRTSSFSFKGKDTPIPEIAQALKVEHILEGSVRKAGDTVRITAQLIDVKTDSHLWSETYDRKYEDIFEIQDEISAHIVAALKVALGSGEIVRTTTQPTQDLAAYEDYLHGRHLWQQRGADNIRRAIELFEDATAADPNFARAWSSLASAHLTMPVYSGDPTETHLPLALQYAEKALELDSSLAEPHAVIAELLRNNRKWIEAEPHYRKAIELEPRNATGYLWYSEHLLATGKSQDGLNNALIALDLDPYNPGVHSVLASAYLNLNDLEMSRRFTRSAMELGHPAGRFLLASLEIYDENYAAARDLMRRDEQLSAPDHPLWLVIAAREDAAQVDALLERARQPDTPLIAEVSILTLFGRAAEAADLLQASEITGNIWLGLWELGLAPLRAQPGFADLLMESGIVAYWDATGWPERCSRDGNSIHCT